MRYIPSVNFPTKTRYDIYYDGVKKFETFDSVIAAIEIEMAYCDVEVKTVKVAK